MRSPAITYLAIVTIAYAALVGCQRSGPEAAAAPSGSSIRIAKTSPDGSSTLRVGDQINLEVLANYTLNADSGTVTLVVQTADNSTISNQFEVVPRGSGTVTLKSSFVVPETNAILVFAPLSAQGQSSTSTVDHRAFKVTPK